MVPVIANGGSFKGALLYYRHDKPSSDEQAAGKDKPTTSKRVGFVATRNLAHDDLDGSLAEMIGVVRAAPLLKGRAGYQQGRPLSKPVKTIALSWHPSQRPDREEMIEAADSFLAAMGWQAHQAILIEHTDTAHAHVHIILSRIHPETGLTLDDSNDRRRAQQWAHQWDADHGQHWCPDRAKKYDAKPGSAARRKQAEGTPHQHADMIRVSVEHFTATDRVLDDQSGKTAHEVHHRLVKRHDAERARFFAERRVFVAALRSEVYAPLKADAAPEWRGHYRYAHVIERRARLDAGKEEKLARQAMAAVAQLQSDVARQKQLARAEQYLAARDRTLEAARVAVAEDRAALVTAFRRELKLRQEEAAAAFANERYADFDALTARHQDERREVAELIAARDAGRRFDTKRLDALLAPAAERSSDADVKARIGKILDRLDAGDTIVDRRETDRWPAGLSWQRKTSQLLLEDFNALSGTLRGWASELDRGAPIELGRQQRLDALLSEVTMLAERGAHAVITRHGKAVAAWADRDPIVAARKRRAVVASVLAEERGKTAAFDDAPRIAVALALLFDPADPFQSLAAALAHEHAQTLAAASRLRTGEGDDEERRFRDLQRQHLLAEHLAALSWRVGRLQEINDGVFADPARGHTAQTRFISWSWSDSTLGKIVWPDYPAMVGKRGKAGSGQEAFARHDAARADTAELRHALDRELARRRHAASKQQSVRKSKAGTAYTQRTGQQTDIATSDPTRAWLDQLRRQQEHFARTGEFGDGSARIRRKALRKPKRVRQPVMTAFRLGDYETTRLWKRGEWRRVTRPPPVAVLHVRGILHAGTDCPFCRLDWGRCPTHPR